MATKKSKSTKKSKKGAAKKRSAGPAKSTAKVELDASTVHQFESALRDGLVASGSVMAAENKKPDLAPTASVKLDADTVARMSEVLRKGLVASHAVMADDNKALNKLTSKVKRRSSKSKKAK